MELHKNFEAGGAEMVVVSESPGDAQSVHEEKGNLIDNPSSRCKAEMVLFPGGIHFVIGRNKERGVAVHEAMEFYNQVTVGFSCGGVSKLEEDKGGADQFKLALMRGFERLYRRLMPLVSRVPEREESDGIDKDLIHG